MCVSHTMQATQPRPCRIGVLPRITLLMTEPGPHRISYFPHSTFLVRALEKVLTQPSGPPSGEVCRLGLPVFGPQFPPVNCSSSGCRGDIAEWSWRGWAQRWQSHGLMVEDRSQIQMCPLPVPLSPRNFVFAGLLAARSVARH